MVNDCKFFDTQFFNHNLIILAHRHPIGSSLSSIDEDCLLALTDWNPDLYWVMISCDIPLGCYESDKGIFHEIEWRIIGSEKKKAGS